jgi:RNA polymerase sigma factor (sigma-70 family)
LLRTLPDRQRAALVLRYYHDLPDAEIGAALHCRAGTVRSLISRGLAALRAQGAGSTAPGSPRRFL